MSVIQTCALTLMTPPQGQGVPGLAGLWMQATVLWSYCLTMSRPASFLNLGFPLCAHTLRVLTHLSPGSCLLELLVIFLTAVLRGLGMELLGVGPPRRGGEAQRRTIGVHLLCGLNDGLQDISKARVSISPFIKPTLSKITPMNEISPEPHVHVPQTTTL